MLLSSTSLSTVPAFSTASLIFPDTDSALSTISLASNDGGVMVTTTSAPVKSSEAASEMSPCTAWKLGSDVNSKGALLTLRYTAVISSGSLSSAADFLTRALMVALAVLGPAGTIITFIVTVDMSSSTQCVV
jgi:hypothetical protein